MITLLCICKLNRYRHISVRVGSPIPQTCLKACKIDNLALIVRKPRHENRRFSESSEGMEEYISRFHFAGSGAKNMPTNSSLDSTRSILTNQMAVNFRVSVSTPILIRRN